MNTSGHKIKLAGAFIFLVLFLPTFIIAIKVLGILDDILIILKSIDSSIDASKISYYTFLTLASIIINLIFAIIVFWLVCVLGDTYDIVNSISATKPNYSLKISSTKKTISSYSNTPKNSNGSKPTSTTHTSDYATYIKLKQMNEKEKD